MRYFLFPLVFILLMPVSAKADDNRKMAGKLNDEIDKLLTSLPSMDNDTSLYYITLQKIVYKAMACDDYDSRPSSSGKVKLRYRKDNAGRISSLMDKLPDGGLYYYFKESMDSAMLMFDTYITCCRHPLFSGNDHRFLSQVAYYASLLCYGIKDYARADSLSAIALHDANYARDAAEIKINCMEQTMDSPQDSARYIVALLQLWREVPGNRQYFHKLIRYFSFPGRESQMDGFINDEIRRDSTNKYIWCLRGEVAMKNKEWPVAAASFERAVSIDTTYIEAFYDMGVSLLSEAQEIKTGIVDIKNKKEVREVALRVKNLLGRAVESLLKTSRLDPSQDIVNWAEPLYQALVAVKDPRAEEIKEKLK